MYNIYNEDCIQGMLDRIEKKSVDLICCDPPFAINFNSKMPTYNRKESPVIDDYREVKQHDYLDFSLNWLGSAKQILKDSGSIYIFSGWNHLKDILIALDELDFELVNIITWKYAFGVNCTKKFISSHYSIIYACLNNKKRKFNTYSRFDKDEKNKDGKGSARYKDMEDVWEINKENWPGCKKTATKLPAEVIRKILSYSSSEGDLVVDPFSGSGQTAWVSKEMKRDFIGFEISEEAYNLSIERLEKNQYLIKEKK
jgi:site-specific DNA-methyltransferase (adenine-specific)